VTRRHPRPGRVCARPLPEHGTAIRAAEHRGRMRRDQGPCAKSQMSLLPRGQYAHRSYWHPPDKTGNWAHGHLRAWRPWCRGRDGKRNIRPVRGRKEPRRETEYLSCRRQTRLRAGGCLSACAPPFCISPPPPYPGRSGPIRPIRRRAATSVMAMRPCLVLTTPRCRHWCKARVTVARETPTQLARSA
jgi:hypothetical protein